MNKSMNTVILKAILQAKNQREAGHLMRKMLSKYYSAEEIYDYPSFIMARGDVPVGLVAHLDTVFDQHPALILHDEEQGLMWSPQGLGSDDRAGCFAIVEILKTSGVRPTIILTTDEEQGCVGAATLVGLFPEKPWDLNFLIELDRQGLDDAVYYGCYNEEFEKYISTFGFETQRGTYSDISVLCPAWGIAGVNLSVGYFYEHTYLEMLSLSGLEDTIRKVSTLLTQETKPYEYRTGNFRPAAYCTHCGKGVHHMEVIYIDDMPFCEKCFSDVCTPCKQCHQVWYNPKKHIVCPRCIEKMKPRKKNNR